MSYSGFDDVGITFVTLAPLLDAFLLSWDHFWRALDALFVPKNILECHRCPKRCHHQNTLTHTINMVGDDKVLMGSDYPFPLGELTPGELIKSMDWSANKKEKVLGSIALKWLNGV